MLVETVTDWAADDGQQKGAALAYYAIFSLAPLLFIAMALAGVLVGHGASRDFVTVRLQSLIGSESARTIDALLSNASRAGASKAARAVGAIVLLMGAWGVVAELQNSLNQIWKTRAKERGLARLIETRLLSLAFVLVAGFILVAALILTASVAAFETYLAGRLPLPAFVLQAMNMAVGFSLSTVLFAMIYKLLPEVRIAWHDACTGAVATSFLFAIGNSFLGIYLGKLSGASAFGAAGAVVLILVWAYYCAQILYLGAEFTRVYAERRARRRAAAAPEARSQEAPR